MKTSIFQGILAFILTSSVIAAPYPHGEDANSKPATSHMDNMGAHTGAGNMNMEHKVPNKETSYNQSNSKEHNKISSGEKSHQDEEKDDHDKESNKGVMGTVMGFVTDNPATRFLGAHCSHGHVCPAMPSTYLEQIKGLFTGDFVNVLNNQYDNSALHQGEKNADDIGLAHSGLKSLTGY